MDEIVTNVYATTDYGKFKILITNRIVIDKVVKKLVKSMLESGWIGAPIVVNERMEVIDGQHRIAAAERIGIPVHYIVMEGLTIASS